MRYYAAFYPVHGVKTLCAASLAQATERFKQNAGGYSPDWVQSYLVKHHDKVKQIARLGWAGNQSAFNDHIRSV